MSLTDIFEQRSIPFTFNKSYEEYGTFLLDSIRTELEKRKVTKFLDNGLWKIVYETSNPKNVVKVMICGISDYFERIREPLEMIVNPYCNNPINIKVFSTEELPREENIENINIDIGTYVVIIYDEERALIFQ